MISTSDLTQIKKEFLELGFVRRNFGDLSERDFLSLAQFLGKPLPIGRHNLPGSRHIQNISEDGLFQREDVPWHNDFSYSVGDYDGTILMMKTFDIDVPTYFCDNCLLFDNLNNSEQKEYSKIQCSYQAPSHYHDLLSETQLKLVLKNQVSKPLVMDHPIAQKKSLYYSPATLISSTSDFNIESLISKAEEVKKAVHYDKNDIVIFDNLRWMHRRPAFEGHRQLWRISFSYV